MACCISLMYGKEHNLSVGPITGLWSWLTRLLRANALLFPQHMLLIYHHIASFLPRRHFSFQSRSFPNPNRFLIVVMSCGCFCTCCVFAGHTFSANSSYLGKMPDVNYSEVDFVNCTQDTLPGGRFIQCGTRGVCARLDKRPLGIGLACHKTNKQPTTLALSVNTICKERFFIPDAWCVRSLL